MNLTLEEIDALLAFLDRQWMPEVVQQVYDKIADEKRARQGAGQRLADLEQRLRDAAAQSRPVSRELMSDEGRDA